MIPTEEYDIELAPQEEVDEINDHAEWVARARDAYRLSDDYFGASIRKQLEKNISMFQSRHPTGSKYHTEEYKYRSKIFRPKTRSIIKRHEAAAALAYFATADTVTALPENPNDERAQVAAMIAKALINYRLEFSIPWFQTVIGAYQDAMVQGVVISKQTWKYKESTSYMEVMDDFGNPTITEQVQVIEDAPDIEIIPVENIRFDPASDWRNPVKSSPYIIERIPMHLYQVKERMQAGGKGEAPWFELDDNDLLVATSGKDDSTRHSREKGRQDSKETHTDINDYAVVWIHRNILQKDGKDWLYYTVGTDHLLSEPVPIEEVYPHGRPYVLGAMNIETHRIYPAGLPELGEGLQAETNDIANQRLDNIKLVLNRRYLARRTANVDWASLTRSVPGGVTLCDDINNDIKVDAPPDVTGSSYQEQDRISVDFDELAGTFSPGSVQSNRSLNETVGGMSMMSQDANTVTEYQLRVFTETWVEPVLRQLLIMERHYETDPIALEVSAGGLPHDQVVQLLSEPISLRVAVGFGATSPQKRVEKLAMGLNTIGQFMPQMMQQIKGKEIISEVFGALGYRDGQRFFELGEQDQDPRMMQMAQQLQEMQQALQQAQSQSQGKMMEVEVRAQIEREKMQLDRMKFEMRAQMDYQIEMARLAQKEGLTMAQLQAKLQMDDKKIETTRQIEGIKAMNFQNELNFKNVSGRDGI